MENFSVEVINVGGLGVNIHLVCYTPQVQKRQENITYMSIV